MPQKFKILLSFAATEYSSNPVFSLLLKFPRWENAGVKTGIAKVSPRKFTDRSATTESINRSSIRIESINFSVITFASDNR